MSYKIGLKYEQQPLEIHAVLKTTEDYKAFKVALDRKWLEYVTPSTTTFEGALSE